MAKAKAPATPGLVEALQDNDFADAEAEPAPRGVSVEDQIDAIRTKRAAQRAARGNAGKRRVITHYHDAERLKNLGLLSPEEVVDCEEAGLLPDPSQFYGAEQPHSTPDAPPDEAV